MRRYMVWSASYLQGTTADTAFARPLDNDRFREARSISALRPVCSKRRLCLNRAGGINAIGSLGSTASPRRVEPPGRVQLLVCQTVSPPLLTTQSPWKIPWKIPWKLPPLQGTKLSRERRLPRASTNAQLERQRAFFKAPARPASSEASSQPDNPESAERS